MIKFSRPFLDKIFSIKFYRVNTSFDIFFRTFSFHKLITCIFRNYESSILKSIINFVF